MAASPAGVSGPARHCIPHAEPRMVDNDPGGILTYSQAGAHFGYALRWTVIPITVALVVERLSLRVWRLALSHLTVPVVQRSAESHRAPPWDATRASGAFDYQRVHHPRRAHRCVKGEMRPRPRRGERRL
jgi:hypothetical protein